MIKDIFKEGLKRLPFFCLIFGGCVRLLGLGAVSWIGLRGADFTKV